MTCDGCNRSIDGEPVYFMDRRYHERCLPDTWGSDPLDNPTFHGSDFRTPQGSIAGGRHTKRYQNAQQEYEAL